MKNVNLRKVWPVVQIAVVVLALFFMTWRSIAHEADVLPRDHQLMYWVALAAVGVSLVGGLFIGWVIRGAFPGSEFFEDDLDPDEDLPDGSVEPDELGDVEDGDEPWNDLRSAAEGWLGNHVRMGVWLERSRTFMKNDSRSEYDAARALALLMIAHAFAAGGDFPTEEHPTYVEELRTFIQWLQARGVLA